MVKRSVLIVAALFVASEVALELAAGTSGFLIGLAVWGLLGVPIAFVVLVVVALLGSGRRGQY